MKIHAFILCTALAALGTVTSTNLAFADPLAQPPTGAMQHQGMGGEHGFASLGLNDAQKLQLRQIHRETHRRITGVLTVDQRAQLKTSTSGEHSRRAFFRALHHLKLSVAQRQEIRAIGRDARQQMLAILTPEQRAKLQSMHHHHADAPRSE